MVLAVAMALGELRHQVTFVGGSAVGFLITNTAFLNVRPTDDVDVVVEVASYGRYQDLLESLRKLGFVHDMEGPLCRLVINGIKVDVMPTDESILNFSNRWYPLAVCKATQLALSEGVSINLVSAPMFVCTKFEAFFDRGKGDYLSSSDIEDIVAILNGRAEFVSECQAEEAEVVVYLRDCFGRLGSDGQFLNALPGILPFEARSVKPLFFQRLQNLAKCNRAKRGCNAFKVVVADASRQTRRWASCRILAP